MKHKVFKLFAIILTCTLIIPNITIIAYGETISDKVQEELKINEFYDVTATADGMVYYKINLDVPGNLVFDFSFNDEKLHASFSKEITAYDEAGNKITSDDTFWDYDSLTLSLNAGTYYIVIHNRTTASGTNTFYLRYETSNTSVIYMTIILKVGSTLQLGTEFIPSQKTTSLTWKSSKTSIATVSDKGVVKAIKAGKTTVKVYTKTGQIASIIVKVTK